MGKAVRGVVFSLCEQIQIIERSPQALQNVSSNENNLVGDIGNLSMLIDGLAVV